jgi:hypothetical protein
MILGHVTLLFSIALLTVSTVSAQVISSIATRELTQGDDAYSLDLDGIRKYSAMERFEVVGHSYLKVDARTDWAKGKGRAGPELGSGFNSVVVYDDVAYLAGYSYPPTIFGILLVDVRDPKDIKELSFIPCQPGTRCTYLRVNPERKILLFGNDPDPTNPTKPRSGTPAQSGWSIYDVSNPRQPHLLSFVPATPGQQTHGMDIDDKHLYGCGSFSPDLRGEGLQVIDYSEPRKARQIATWHVPGMRKDETREPLNTLGPDGKPQILRCHEIVYYNDRLYIAWRDAGVKILDISDRTKPNLLATFDYVPPFHGGFLGAAHTAMPVVVTPGQHPSLVVVTDEIFDCPSGFGRILDVSDIDSPEVKASQRPANLQVLSTFRAPHAQDVFDAERNEFRCLSKLSGPDGGISNTTHLPLMDRRSSSLLYVTWYDEGVRVLDISNPFVPKEIGYYLSPRYAAPGGYDWRGPGSRASDREDRSTRELFQDPATNLLYMTDGAGGGLTILRYTGPIPKAKPLPGAR